MSARPNGRMEARKRTGYKVSVHNDHDHGRRKREENLLQIRKNNRDQGLLKKRREGIQPPLRHTLETLSSLAAAVMSQDAAAQLHGTTQFRKLSCVVEDQPVDEIIKMGVVPYFVDFLRRVDTPQLQFEAAWILTNIASGTSEQTMVVVESGAVPLFVELLSSPNEELCEQVAWGLGNIAGDSSKCRDIVLGNGGMMNLLCQFNENATIPVLRNATWTLANFCRGKPRPPFQQVKAALPILNRLIHMADEEILADACWALSYLSDGNDDDIEAIIGAGVCGRLIDLLRHPSSALFPSLRTIGNIVTGNDAQTQYIVDSGVLPCLFALITNDNRRSVKKEACWTISNIAAGNQDQIQAVIDSKTIPQLVWLVANAEFEVKREVAWAITNATSRGTHEQIECLVDQDCVKPLCDLLSCPDTKIVTICLEGLENILRAGDDGGHNDKYLVLLEDAGGVDKIEALQEHENNNIYEISVRILENYLAYDMFFDADANKFECPSKQPSASFMFD